VKTTPIRPSWSGAIPPGKEVLLAQLQALFVSAIQNLEHAGRTVYDCANEVPWACLLDMARQVWDASRHTEIYERLLRHVDSKVGEYLEARILTCRHA
jgi:hypothetical protein